jgi:hypothetical protein
VKSIDYEAHFKKIIKIQALCRGFLVRKNVPISKSTKGGVKNSHLFDP